jgi:hypothetical protein
VPGRCACAAQLVRRAGSVAPAKALIAAAGAGDAGRFRLRLAQGGGLLRTACTQAAQVLTDHAARG